MDFSIYGISPDTDDAKWSAIRNIRDAKLKECDWTRLPDVSIDTEKVEAWTSYRLALWDIPQVFDSPDAVVFPDPPIN